MTKAQERTYFKEIGPNGVTFSLHKPFSDPVNIGSLLSDIAAVLTLLPEPPAKLLDLGCGSGWTSNFYAQAGYDVTGLDLAPEAIEAAKAHFTHPQLEFICSDYDKVTFDQTYDAVVFFDSLHHSDDEQVPLSAAFQSLKPGGTIILCEPGKGHSTSPSSREAVAKYGVSERDMPPKLSRRALKKAGFANIKTYAYPALAHRAAYKNRSSGIKRLTNTTVGRGLSMLGLATVLKGSHGIVVATKPL